MREEKKTGFFDGLGKFFRSVVAELKKVAWPTRRETFVYTTVVIATCIVVAAIIGAFDIGLKALYDIVYVR
jgi:preprotein translocase subunit SecE